MALFASDEVENARCAARTRCAQHRGRLRLLRPAGVHRRIGSSSRGAARTCAQLAAIADPPEAVIAAAEP